MSNETENFYDQQVEFTYEGKEYTWEGDYTIEQSGEDESEYAPAYVEFEVTIDCTTSLTYYDEDLEVNVEVKPTNSILVELQFQIERNY
jgi:uncharacterized OB-fold protein